MLYQVFEPPPELAPYVRFFWALESDVRPGEEFVHRSMADGCVEIVFHYCGVFDELTATGAVADSPLASIQAQSTTYRRFVTTESFGIFGAYLYPFAIPKLFSFPASDLQTYRLTSNRSLVLTEDVWMNVFLPPTAMKIA